MSKRAAFGVAVALWVLAIGCVAMAVASVAAGSKLPIGWVGLTFVFVVASGAVSMRGRG